MKDYELEMLLDEDLQEDFGGHDHYGLQPAGSPNMMKTVGLVFAGILFGIAGAIGVNKLRGSKSYTPHMDLEYFAEQIGGEIVEEYNNGFATTVVYVPKSQHTKAALLQTMKNLGVGPFDIESISDMNNVKYWKIT